ncbi:MAG: hypothetical protein K0R05_4 [Anaerocolumna sp.]|jgi:hypothetical protein|nr:hypothetical protein [Anaerocolumna sp.]
MKDEKDIFNNNGDTEKDEFNNDDIFSRLEDNSEMEDADDDLLALLDMISAQDEMQKGGNSDYAPAKESPKKPQQEEAPIFSLDDFDLETSSLDMASMDASDTEPEEEITDSFEADKILTVQDLNSETKEKSLDNMGDVFSDALSAMDRLEDEELPATEPAETEKKLGFFQRLFGKRGNKDKADVKDNTKLSKEDKKKAKAKEKEVAKKKAAQEKAEKARAAKAQAKKPEPEPLSAEEKAKQEKAKEAKAKKAAAKTEKKKTADAKKVEKKKAATDNAAIKAEKKKAKAELNPPDPEDNIKLNPLGIVFIMTFFILIAGVVIIGTNTYSYNLGIKNASTSYSRGRYMEAYNSIFGLNVKEKDAETYDKIITTMYVYKQLNSYYNYTELQKKPEALDSLLKGLNRYDTHIEHATELGIEKNLGSIKKQLLKELKENYGMTEKQAKSINAISDHTKYSLEVINIASDKK